MKTIPALALLLALSACSQPAATTAASSASPTVVTAKTYSKLTDLRDDVIAAGYSCPDWQQTNKVTLAAASGSCSDNDVLSIYLNSADVSKVVQNLKSINSSVHLLVGPNWIFNTQAAETFQPKLGGTVVRQ